MTTIIVTGGRYFQRQECRRLIWLMDEMLKDHFASRKVERKLVKRVQKEIMKLKKEGTLERMRQNIRGSLQIDSAELSYSEQHPPRQTRRAENDDSALSENTGEFQTETVSIAKDIEVGLHDIMNGIVDLKNETQNAKDSLRCIKDEAMKNSGISSERESEYILRKESATIDSSGVPEDEKSEGGHCHKTPPQSVVSTKRSKKSPTNPKSVGPPSTAGSSLERKTSVSPASKDRTMFSSTGSAWLQAVGSPAQALRNRTVHEYP